MNKKPTYVIVGASLAGATAAQALRDEGFTGRIVLIGQEHERPYERPPLSKGYLQGKDDRSKIYVHPEHWYADHDVDLLLGRRATVLDRAARTVELDTGERIGYTKLLLATGASPRHLKVPGLDQGPGLGGVHYLRRVEDSDSLRAAIRDGGRVVIVGAGWIGLETAAVARDYGCDVTVIDPQPTPLTAALGGEMGQFFAGLHRRNGVDLRLGQHMTGLLGTGRVSGVVIDTSHVLSADTVVVGIGATPNTQLAEQAGLTCHNGIIVDESLRTSDPDIYAAGDVANAFNPFYDRHLRTEHWANALHSPPVAAKAMLGQPAVYDQLPYFFTDQYDVGMEFTGWFDRDGYDRVVIRGDIDQHAFHAFWIADDRVVAGMQVNRWDDGLTPIQELIRSKQRVDADHLADTSMPLAEQAMAQ